MQTSGGDNVRPTDGANAAVDFAFGSDSTRDRGRDQVNFCINRFVENLTSLGSIQIIRDTFFGLFLTPEEGGGSKIGQKKCHVLFE